MAEPQEIDVSKRSVIVKMIADVASQGVYNGITPAASRNMNTVFQLTARLINEMEAEEAAEAEEELKFAAAMQANDDNEESV